jgi:hypothetical protein
MEGSLMSEPKKTVTRAELAERAREFFTRQAGPNCAPELLEKVIRAGIELNVKQARKSGLTVTE